MFRSVQLLAGVLLVIGTLTSAAVAARTTVTDVRLGIHADKTRFVMEVSEKPDFRLFYLNNPYRIVIDMQELDWEVPDSKGRTSAGLVQQYRYGLFRRGTSRVVLDFKQPVKVLKQVILPPGEGKPYRFFIDIQKTSDGEFQQAVEASRNVQLASLPKETKTVAEIIKNQKHTIVVDAGHGGIDPGAIGKSGVHEKKLTLAVAQRLARILKSRGDYNVVMTRDDDTFLSLKERVNVARNVKADLFISVHADSIGRADVRGSTVYTLSETASDKEAEALASSHNKSDIIAGVDLDEQDDTVQGILIDLAQRETMNFSVKFAKYLIPEIAQSGMKLGSRSHRFAGFRVLKAPDVPSVLVELGYLSNRQDEKILKSDNGQEKLARSIAAAVDKYFGTIKP
ncbi:N-acetylmuramoyl-L-alanine amidase [Sneathiella chinensis]|uniref:N-acetylmuramoyl-L-alanine amidase n=1 Tax=Sneathiella chinensis TaxID=349750 RepID=UPI0024E180C3|nr:N-acetylmuramoyl-L-alanine amidase [Sneathiella chinensis]